MYLLAFRMLAEDVELDVFFGELLGKKDNSKMILGLIICLLKKTFYIFEIINY